MIKTVVGIDVETTSLNAKEGEIIEVAAIRYDLISGAELARYESLAKPLAPIAQITTDITGSS